MGSGRPLLYKLSHSPFVGVTRVMSLLELRILELHSFPHFSPTCFDILT